MDVVISYGGFEHIVELKIWHGQKYREKGLQQLKSYLDSRSCTKGYLISFNFHENKEYLQNRIVLGESQSEVFEIVV